MAQMWKEQAKQEPVVQECDEASKKGPFTRVRVQGLSFGFKVQSGFVV